MVQLHQNAQDAENDAGNGRWRVADALVDGRSLREDGRRCAEARQARSLQKVSRRNFKLRHYPAPHANSPTKEQEDEWERIAVESQIDPEGWRRRPGGFWAGTSAVWRQRLGSRQARRPV
ncbi:hypothetical protein MES5069_180044 [Mesorhizobium escarrei]|uniref:Uncharacterized protein n=1 Tax=Mesorhizobium escarrei TaxID=666018 RepID=A0ABM9DM45_9HYPH|nr:hypothetical protein MES5069_180044 [Mesorhizobium escarrei]